MLELRRALSEPQNILSRLFHIELKDQVRAALAIMDKMPMPSIRNGELECYNSRLLVDIRNDLLSHIPDKRNQKIIDSAVNFIILLYDSDEAWRRLIYQAILRIKEAEFKPEGEPRLATDNQKGYWRK